MHGNMRSRTSAWNQHNRKSALWSGGGRERIEFGRLTATTIVIAILSRSCTWQNYSTTVILVTRDLKYIWAPGDQWSARTTVQRGRVPGILSDNTPIEVPKKAHYRCAANELQTRRSRLVLLLFSTTCDSDRQCGSNSYSQIPYIV